MKNASKAGSYWRRVSLAWGVPEEHRLVGNCRYDAARGIIYLFCKEMNTLLLTTLYCLLAVSTSHSEEQMSLKLASKSGHQGWTLATAKHSQGEWMNSTLVIVTRVKVEKKFRVSRAFIEVWGFVDSDSAVVVRSRNSHGPSWIEKFDIATGRLLAECRGSDHLKDTPNWAQPWCDEPIKAAEVGAGQPATRPVVEPEGDD